MLNFLGLGGLQDLSRSLLQCTLNPIPPNPLLQVGSSKSGSLLGLIGGLRKPTVWTSGVGGVMWGASGVTRWILQELKRDAYMGLGFRVVF